MRLESRVGVIAAVLGFTGVALGAFGTHALGGTVPPPRLETWETAVRYHLIHAVVLVAVAVLARTAPTRALALAGVLLPVGVLVFAGTLYLLVLLDLPVLGAVTPLGGILLLAGWMAVGAHFLALGRNRGG
ncbi:MAG: DUF423 domain-containing protein [Gemmatimonadetes bacterium]|nr:DUF423 domain-containing protein [Gemmatimonadota bacterium]